MVSIREMFASGDLNSIESARVMLSGLPEEAAKIEFQTLTQDSDPVIRAHALTINIDGYSPVIVEFARTLLQDPVSFVRWRACEVLQFCRCTQAADEVAKLLVTDPSAAVRSSAAAALGTIGHPGLLDQMVQAAVMESANDYEGTPIRVSIQTAIGQIRRRHQLADPAEQ